MKTSRRIAAALLSGIIAAASVQAVMPVVGSAAVTRNWYDARDVVWEVDDSLFCAPGETEPNAKFVKALQTATGVKDYMDITFGDLEKVLNLNLSSLGLDGIPRVIEYMTRLRTLDLSKNKLRSSTVNNIDLSACVQLTRIDLSYNYLTSVPAWLSALDASTKNLSNNLINTTGQRNIMVEPTVYYFGVGDSLTDEELNAFKDKVLSTVCLNDKSKLPEYFFDPDLPTYDIPDDASSTYLKNENIELDLDVSSFVTKGVVTKAGSAKGTIRLFAVGATTNPKIQCEFTVYFLDGNDPTTVKIRLESLIGECDKLTEDTYTAPSWTVFSNQLKTAKAILSYNNNDYDMLKNAYDSLKEAKDNLVGGVNTNTKKILTDLIAIAKTYKEEEYTAESWKKLASALTRLTDANEDKSTSLDEANAAIKAFQDAQNELVPTKQVNPAIIPKSDFENIYGENKTITAKGATRDGWKYSWKFTGTDIVKPADFDPQVFYESKVEEQIRFEVGSASDYLVVSFAETKAFPGTAELTLDVSGVYTNGVYRLYKWNTSAKKSEFIREVDVVDGSATIRISEGGDYFISSVLQNFQMISSNFKINHDKLTIIANLGKLYTVADFRQNIENGEAVYVTNSDGTAVSETQLIATGMKAAAPNSDVSYTLIVMGDVDGDGRCTTLDALTTLKAATGNKELLPTYEQKFAADLTGDGRVWADDALRILKYAVGVSD